jgi:nucleoside 2-deoxyribosyltransferase
MQTKEVFMLVYLAGPISGLNYEGATNWRDHAKSYLNEFGIKGLSPLREQDHLKEVGVFKDAQPRRSVSSRRCRSRRV